MGKFGKSLEGLVYTIFFMPFFILEMIKEEYKEKKAKRALRKNPVTTGYKRLIAFEGRGEFGEIEIIEEHGKRYLIEKEVISAFAPYGFLPVSCNERIIRGIRGEIIREGEIYAEIPSGFFADYRICNFYDYKEIDEKDPRFLLLKQRFELK